MRTMTKIVSVVLAMLFAVSMHAGNLYYEGVYYESVGEMRVKIVASEGAPYAGRISIPNFFNVITMGIDGTPIENSYFVTEVGDSAFMNCTELKEVTFEGATTKFGKKAFYGCTSLREMKFPVSWAADTEIGESAFEGCSTLYGITLGNRVAPISNRAFAGCTELCEIEIGATEPPILGIDAFDSSILSVAEVRVPASALSAYKATEGWGLFKKLSAISAYSFEKDGVYYLIDELNPKRVKVTFDGYGSYSGDVVIPEYVVSQGVTYTVTELGRDAFRGSANMTSVSLPESLNNIGINCFQGCSSLTSITLPSTISTLPSECFRDCSSLKSFTCPPMLGRIMSSVFRGCTALENVDFSTAPSVYLIGAYAFGDCVKLKEFHAPEAMNLIGNYAFQNCTALEVVEAVPNWTYWYAEGAFAGCNNIKNITLYTTTPPRCPNENMFTAAVYANANLIVPAGTEDAYRASVHGDNNTPDVWQKFVNINSSHSSIDKVEASNSLTSVYYNLQGVELAQPVKGTPVIKVTNGKAVKLIF